jgi:hypothetical protein
MRPYDTNPWGTQDGWMLFTDGFESGDPSAWSGAIQ